MLEPDILDELMQVRASGNPTACFPPVTSVAFLRNNFAGKIRPPRVGDTMSRVSHATKRLTSAALLKKKDFDNPGTLALILLIVFSGESAIAQLLSVQASKRYLVDQNGNPFLLVGDAAWSLIAQLPDSDVDYYFAQRQQMGFTTSLINVIEHQFATNAPNNIYNQPPFDGNLFTTPDSAYFAHVDHVVISAAQHNIVVMLDPTYVGYACGGQGWCAEIQAAATSDLTAWGQFLGQRYARYDNIIWVIGGDTNPPSSVRAKLRAFIAGLKQYDTRHFSPPMSTGNHPP